MRESTPSSRIAAGASRKSIIDFMFDSAKHAPQGGEALELAELLIPRAERAGGEVFPADLAEPQARRPDRRLEVGHLEVDHFMAPRLEPPPQGRERIEVSRRGETQDADTTHGSSSLVTFVLVPFIFDSGNSPLRPGLRWIESDDLDLEV